MRMHRPPRAFLPHQRGLSIVELMIALTIGLLLLAGLSLLFAESSRSHRELSESSRQIENGRYALQLLTDNLHLDGFYGRFSDLSTIATPATEPDPCEVTDTDDLYEALPVHIQGYAAANFTTRPTVSTLCAAYLPAANLQPGSDVLVIRRADTQALTQDTDTAVNHTVYIQASNTVEIQKGAGNVITTSSKADGTTAAAVTNRDGTAAPIRQYHVHVYFVAPCSMPSGGTTDIPVCTSSDDGGRPTPTLKRLELSVNSAGSATAMKMVSLVEGIEMLKVDYGLDTLPNPNSNGGIGDGAPELPFVKVPATSPSGWLNVVAANLYLLSRNPQPTTGHTDSKTYAMGLSGNYTPGGSYKRHAYTASVRLGNPAMRREIP